MIDRLNKMYGNTIDEQEAYLKKMFMITIPMIVIGVFFPALLGLAALIWGWRFMCAIVGIAGLASLFSNNIVTVVCVIILWAVLGYFAGIINFIMGIVKFFQIRSIRKNGKG